MLVCTILSIGMLSCSSYRKTIYLNDIPDSLTSGSMRFKVNNYIEPVIQQDDILQISIQTLDPESNNLPVTSNNSSFQTQPTSSATNTVAQSAGATVYLVDKSGYIELPLVGKLYVADKTTSEVRDDIRERASIYFKNPVVNIRFANFRVTVLGEVNRPAQYIVPNEKVNILDMLGMAGDLTIYGKRDNVMLIRETGGEKTVTRFNLNSSDIFQSPYYYLRQGDIIYVQPSKSKTASTDMVKARNFSLIATGLSLMAVIFSRVTF